MKAAGRARSGIDGGCSKAEQMESPENGAFRDGYGPENRIEAARRTDPDGRVNIYCPKRGGVA